MKRYGMCLLLFCSQQHTLVAQQLFSLPPVPSPSSLSFFLNDSIPAPPKPGFWQTKGVRVAGIPIGLFAASALTWGKREEIMIRDTQSRLLEDIVRMFNANGIKIVHRSEP